MDATLNLKKTMQRMSTNMLKHNKCEKMLKTFKNIFLNVQKKHAQTKEIAEL